MKKIFAAQDLLSVGHVRNLLEQGGIQSELRNYYLGGGIGDLPVNECWPEVWVDEADYHRAGLLLEALAAEEQASPPGDWTCPRCGEVNEGQFGECWQCGTLRLE